MTRRDYILAAIIGVLTSIFFIPLSYIVGLSIPYRIILLPILFPLMMMAGIWLGGLLQEALGFGVQFSKYAAAGILSFSIDFGILNILSYITGITAGATIGWINMPGFLVALTNAYLWNKFWVFGHREGGIFSHFAKFLLVMAIDITINSLVLIGITSYISAPAWTSSAQWLNIAKGIATLFAIIWNFFGYRFIAFV